MERAGNEDMSDDVERKGLGTPATRADIIEKLVKDGFVKREKKQMIPTDDGMKLITVLPDVVKSPKLTADWENALTLVAKGEMEREDFMADIEAMVSDLIHTYHEVSDEQKKHVATYADICALHGKTVMASERYLDKSIELLKKANDLKADDDFKYQLAKAFYLKKQYNDALEALPKSNKHYYVPELHSQILSATSEISGQPS